MIGIRYIWTPIHANYDALFATLKYRYYSLATGVTFILNLDYLTQVSSIKLAVNLGKYLDQTKMADSLTIKIFIDI